MHIRVKLRPFSIDDAGQIAVLCANPESRNWFPADVRPADLDTARTYVKRAIDDRDSQRCAVFAIETLAASQLIGEIRLCLRDAKLAYWLGLPFRGNHYMVDALDLVARHARDEFKLEVLYADVIRENIASRRTLEKADFRFQAIFTDDTARAWRHVALLRYKRML